MFKNTYSSRQGTKSQVERLAAKLNVEVDDETDSDNYCIFMYTPKGFRFKATECHTAATSFSTFDGTKAEAWGHCMEDLDAGTEECDNPNCGYCERGKQNE